jgi:hypothetical protein
MSLHIDTYTSTLSLGSYCLILQKQQIEAYFLERIDGEKNIDVACCYHDIAVKFLTLGIKQQLHPNSDIKHLIGIGLKTILFCLS